jgi:hypothetical protein
MRRWGGMIVGWGGIIAAAVLLPGGLPLLAWALYRKRFDVRRFR